MAHGYVTLRRERLGRRLAAVIHARGESQGIVVWTDDGFPTIADAIDRAGVVAAAFTVTNDLGQHHKSWSQVVAEAETL